MPHCDQEATRDHPPAPIEINDWKALPSPIETEAIMVDMTVADGKLILDVRGADKLWALKSSLEIPLEHIAAIRADQSGSLESFSIRR